MDWLDRCTGGRSATPTEPFVPGQWRYYGQSGIGIRDTQARPGDFLLPASDGRCKATTLGAIRCDPHYAPDDDALRSLQRVGAQLELREKTGTWLEWTYETPLLPPLDDALEQTPLELALSQKLGYLEAVCQCPRAHLSTEEERLLVARCKRPSARAPEVLAARSEDWERRTLWGIRPLRVLSIVRDQKFDIYENRLAVALVTNLDAALLRRIRVVRRIEQLLRQTGDYQDVLDGSQNYRRARRVLALWGDAVGDQSQYAHALAVLRRLVALRRRVLALKDTLLYRQLGRARSTRLQLRMTNVLIHDPTYRRVAELWRAWEDYVRQEQTDPATRWRSEQAAAQGFDRFVFLIIVRALDCLGYLPAGSDEEVNVGTADRLTLRGPVGQAVLQRDDSGVRLMSEHTDRVLEVVSLPAMLEASGTVGGWLNSLRDRRSSVFVFLPADEPRASEDDRIRLRSLGNQGEGAGPMFIPAAPWDLESVERMARAVRWYLWSALFDRFPFRVEQPHAWKPPGSPPNWLRIGSTRLYVVRPPVSSDQVWRELEGRIASTTAVLTELKAEVADCDSKDGKRKRLKQRIDEVGHAIKDDQAVLDGLKHAIGAVSLLLNCPVCRKQASPYAFQDREGMFRCTCTDCKSSWGRRLCGYCHGHVPWIDFAGNTPSQDLHWADRRYGCDVLALPLAEGVFLCPHCGGRSDGDR